MALETLERLRMIDQDQLTRVVRQDQRSQGFEILRWQVDPLAFVPVNQATGGLYRFSGMGGDERGERDWSVVLKVVNQGQLDPRQTNYWRRETLVCQTCLLETLPGPLKAPRCYGVVDDPNQAWIWMEFVAESAPKRWELAHYAKAARELGVFQAAFLNGEPVPDMPWLCNRFMAQWVAGWYKLLNPDNPQSAWTSPAVQAHFGGRREQIMDTVDESTRFLEALDRLPRVFSHNDFHRRNLLIRGETDGISEVVVVDWNFSGSGPVGGDLGGLVGSSLMFFEHEPADAKALYDCCFDAYQAGLSEAGCGSHAGLARLGSLITIALSPGTILPVWTQGYAEIPVFQGTALAQFGRGEEETFKGWEALTDFCMDCGDEARHMLDSLGW